MFAKTKVMSISEFMNQKKMDDISFFLQRLEMEVRSNPNNYRKLYTFKKITMTALITSVTFLATANVALASPINSNALPPEIDTLLIKLQLICLALSATLAILTLMLAGTFRMIGLSSKANSWTAEILKGLVQVLVAAPIVGIIVTTIRVFTKGLPGFVPF